MVIAGRNYEFLYADGGINCRVNDGGVWSKSKISTFIEDNEIGIPPSKLLPDSGRLGIVPFVFLGNDEFAFKSYARQSSLKLQA